MPLHKDEALELIYACLREVSSERVDMAPVKLAPETRLLGEGQDLDSLEIITLIASLEMRLAEALSKPVVLVNEDAFEGGHVFRDVSSLAEHIVRLSET
jgi:acyl carrier protein